MTDAPAGRAVPRSPGRRRVAARMRLDFWLDAALLAAFVVAESFGLTGDAIHEWLGLGLGLALLVHLTLHWDWVLTASGRLLRRGGRDRVLWAVNLALLLTMTLCVASGVLISRVALPYLGVLVPGGEFWTRLHSITADLTIVFVGVHVGLRWRWLTAVGRRLLTRRRAR
jgi:hypothetical protein